MSALPSDETPQEREDREYLARLFPDRPPTPEESAAALRRFADVYAKKEAEVNKPMGKSQDVPERSAPQDLRYISTAELNLVRLGLDENLKPTGALSRRGMEQCRVNVVTHLDNLVHNAGPGARFDDDVHKMRLSYALVTSHDEAVAKKIDPAEAAIFVQNLERSPAPSRPFDEKERAAAKLAEKLSSAVKSGFEINEREATIIQAAQDGHLSPKAIDTQLVEIETRRRTEKLTPEQLLERKIEQSVAERLAPNAPAAPDAPETPEAPPERPTTHDLTNDRRDIDGAGVPKKDPPKNNAPGDHQAPPTPEKPREKEPDTSVTRPPRLPKPRSSRDR